MDLNINGVVKLLVDYEIKRNPRFYEFCEYLSAEIEHKHHPALILVAIQAIHFSPNGV